MPNISLPLPTPTASTTDTNTDISFLELEPTTTTTTTTTNKTTSGFPFPKSRPTGTIKSITATKNKKSIVITPDDGGKDVVHEAGAENGGSSVGGNDLVGGLEVGMKVVYTLVDCKGEVKAMDVVKAGGN
ncbi:hypothetical protein MMC28_002113 [Mycoblastus sanguinarius]|nr:hypothetical protein [Mycoblastus sanguinarius]